MKRINSKIVSEKEEVDELWKITSKVRFTAIIIGSIWAVIMYLLKTNLFVKWEWLMYVLVYALFPISSVFFLVYCIKFIKIKNLKPKFFIWSIFTLIVAIAINLLWVVAMYSFLHLKFING
ncbi:MAG: hypothetical protein Q7S33_04795 [Nanoarchaeota archaeon]|nr:hypothetical protein [Nanoarchaeota archaeon]